MGGFDGLLYLAVACFMWFLPEEYSTWIILGDYFRIRRIQRFLVRQWIHVTASQRVFRCLFPYTTQCLVLCGTCSATVTGFASWLRCTSRCVPLGCSRPKIFSILFDVDQKDSDAHGVCWQHRMIRTLQTVQLLSPWRWHRCSSWTSY